MAAVLPVAVTAMAAKGATIATSVPVIWHFLGYAMSFQAALVAGGWS